MGVLEDEVDWIRRSCAGDPSAFEPLVARYQRMVHALTYRMTGSTADAEDLARVLGCAETTVSWRLFAARNKLRRLLKHLG